MKKLLVALALATPLFVAVGLFVGSQAAQAGTPWQDAYWAGVCSQGHFGTGCKGYFSGVTPGCIASGICPTDKVLANGVNVNSGAALISTISNALNGGSTEDKCGAAFTIEVMLGHGPFGSNCNAGINAAKSNFATWQALVTSYANSTNPSYGIQWNVTDNPSVNSSWWPSINDDVFHENAYHCTRTAGCPGTFNSYGTECANALADAAHGCGGKYRDDETTGWVWKTVNVGIPVIKFYFPGGSFELERGCDNLVGNLNAPPTVPSNRPPVGAIAVSCDAALEQQVATVTFSDPDASTTGYITAGSWTSGTSNSPGPTKITIPQSAVSPFAAQTVTLYAKDTGPSGSQNYQVVATANTNVPCATLGCGSMSITPTRLDPYMNFSVAVNVTNNVNQVPPGATMKLGITPPSGAAYTFNGVQGAGGSGSVSMSTFNGVGPTNATGVYTATWILQWASGTKTCTGTFPVVYLPYLSVFGGDVSVGTSPSDASGSCSLGTNTNSGIYSWNNDTTNFSGGGAQYAVQALAAIVDFSSAQSASVSAPTSLSFANYFNPADASKLNSAQGLFGGYAGASAADCNYTSDITTPPLTGDTTIGVTTVAMGATKIYYVKDADVYINGNVVYANSGGGWTATQIPYFKLVVVGGNIYVGSNVTELDGIYVAEPEAGLGGGNIYTCASGLRAPANPTLLTYYSMCNKQLVINGSFVAGQVQFLRTYGSVGQARNTDTFASNHSGEVFNYTPELWLPRAGVAPNEAYSAMTGLPPVL